MGELTAAKDNISDVLAFATKVSLILGVLLETTAKTVMRNIATQLISCDKSLCSNTACSIKIVYNIKMRVHMHWKYNINIMYLI